MSRNRLRGATRGPRAAPGGGNEPPGQTVFGGVATSGTCAITGRHASIVGRVCRPALAGLRFLSALGMGGDAASAFSHVPPALHINPIGVGAPGVPEGSGEGIAAVGDAGIPLAGLQPAAGDVGLAVAREIADLNVYPSHIGIPGGP